MGAADRNPRTALRRRRVSRRARDRRRRDEDRRRHRRRWEPAPSWSGVRCRPARSEAARPCWATVPTLVGELGDGRLPVGYRAVRARRPRRPADQRGHDRLARPRSRCRDRRAARVIESDLRAAALAEARFGAGAGVSPFLFAIVGTGASACLVVDGRPYAGGRGEAIVLGAPPVELVASGPALARAAGLERAEDVLADPAHAALVDTAATCTRRRARRARQRARPRRWSSSGAASGAEPASGSASRGRASHCSRTPARPRFRSSARRSAPDGGMVGAALVALADERLGFASCSTRPACGAM